MAIKYDKAKAFEKFKKENPNWVQRSEYYVAQLKREKEANEKLLKRKAIREEMKRLRYTENLPYSTIAAKYNISRQRVSQIIKSLQWEPF